MPWLQTQVYGGFTEQMSQEDKSRADDLTINVWPTTTDCVDWSQDAEVVISAGDDLQLLIPKLKIVEDTSESIWELLRLRATAFSAAELQQEDPISTKSASIGEEISSADVVRARWTPTGIAKHGRCALLVLTQNLLLSLWSPEKQPRHHQDWQRRIIINHVLQHYFEDLHPELKRDPPAFRSEKLKELNRVRAFAISRPFDATFARFSSLTLDDFCLIAVSNDNNEVVILQCRGGGSDEKGDTTVTVETHFSLSDESTPVPNLNWTFEDYMEQSRFVQHLAWSPWVTDADGRLRSLLLCAGRTRLQFWWVMLNFSLGKLEIAVEDFEGVVSVKKPLTPDAIVEWLPDLIDRRYGQLVAYTHDKVFKLTIDLIADEVMKSVKYDRTSWAQPAGTLYLTPPESKNILQTLPHMTSFTDFLTSIDLETMKGTSNHRTDLQEAITFNRSVFDTKFETHGNVLTRLWGLALSPLQDIMVTSATFHPSNSPEYIIPADMSSRVIFQVTKREDFVTQAIQQGASTEALAFSAKWMVKSMKTQPEKNTAIWRLLDQLDKAMDAIKTPEPDPAKSSLKDLLFMAPTMIRFRYERVLSVMIGHTDAAKETEKQILEQIAARVLNIPASRFMDTNASRLMLAHLRRILVMLKLSDEDDDYLIESCNICFTDIPFDSYASAQCGQGHEFQRCALTFLAIQAPGLCKFCGVCGKQFLKSSYVEKQDPFANSGVDVDTPDATSDDDSRLAPLTELLAEACDRCIYCGGKFIG